MKRIGWVVTGIIALSPTAAMASAAKPPTMVSIAASKAIAYEYLNDDLSEWSSDPRLRFNSQPRCTRMSPRHTLCTYFIGDRRDAAVGGTQGSRLCERNVDVQLARGKRLPTSRLITVDCKSTRVSKSPY